MGLADDLVNSLRRVELRGVKPLRKQVVIRFVSFVSRFASLRGSYALLIQGKPTTKPQETQRKSHKIDRCAKTKR